MNRETKFLIIAVIIVSIFAFYFNNRKNEDEESRYWETINKPTSYVGNGYKITFPCSDIKSDTYLSNSDLISKSDSCFFFGGENHNEIDIYSVTSVVYLSSKYNIYDDVECSDNIDEFTGEIHTVIHNETRQVKGTSLYICAWDNYPLLARVINNNVLYKISVLPNDSKTTYQKLNNFLTTFQLGEYSNN